MQDEQWRLDLRDVGERRVRAEVFGHLPGRTAAVPVDRLPVVRHIGPGFQPGDGGERDARGEPIGPRQRQIGHEPPVTAAVYADSGWIDDALVYQRIDNRI